MKTKIIYISGSEVFDMADIRAAFEEVRLALNLDKNTVLFGVPVDNDDAGLSLDNKTPSLTEEKNEPLEEVVEETEIEIPEEEPEVEQTIVAETPVKKRGRPRKQVIDQEEDKATEPAEDKEDNEDVEIDEKIIPILSMLSNDESVEDENTTETEETDETEEDDDEESVDEEEIIDEETNENIIDEEFENLDEGIEIEDEEPDLEKLLSEMTPLGEDLSSNVETEKETEEPENVDATLEQLATEYVQNQDKIKTESKSSSRGRFSTLTDILPFKPKNKKEPLSGDLFSWGGLAANDEEFSVPGFFTKK